MHHEPYWVEKRQTITLLPVSNFFDLFLPRSLRCARLRKELIGEIDTIVMRNVENLRWAALQKIEDVFRRFETQLETTLRDSIESIREAMTAVRRQRGDHADSMDIEIARAESAKCLLENIHSDLETMA